MTAAFGFGARLPTQDFRQDNAATCHPLWRKRHWYYIANRLIRNP